MNMDLDAADSAGAPVSKAAHGKTSTKTTKRQKYKRRRYFVAPNVQVRMTAELTLLWLVGAALAIINLYVLYALGELYQTDALRVDTVHWQENLMVWTYGVVSVIIGALLFLLACVYYTHRIAGPAHKLEKHLQELAKGDLRLRVALRKSDHLRNLARAINLLTRQSEQSISSVRASVERLRKAAEENDEPAVLEICAELENAIGHYKTSPDVTK